MSSILSPHVFEIGFNQLKARWNDVDLSKIKDAYYSLLREELSNEQFQLGIKTVFRDNTFFPSPKNIIDAGKGSVEHRAELAYANIIKSLFHGGKRELDNVGSQALESLGGIHALASGINPNTRSQFIKSYAALEVESKRQQALALPEPEDIIPD